jgi:hypothetical protein
MVAPIRKPCTADSSAIGVCQIRKLSSKIPALIFA